MDLVRDCHSFLRKTRMKITLSLMTLENEIDQFNNLFNIKKERNLNMVLILF